MADEFAPTNLRSRLDNVQDKIAQARTSLEANGIVGDQLDDLTGFVDEHDRIRSTLDREGTVTELAHAKASAQTDKLESALNRWLKGVEGRFEHPAPRKPNVSM